MLIISPLVEHLRSVENAYGDTPRAVLTIVWLDIDRVFLSAFFGKMTRAEHSDFHQQLRAKGVKHTHRVRRGEFETQEI